ncbi:MAG: hypothetical protein ACLFT7_08640 [Thermoplasmata archaeon]
MTEQRKLVFYCPFCKRETFHEEEDKYFDGSGTRYRCTRCDSYVEKGEKISDIEAYLRGCEQGVDVDFRELKDLGLNYEDIKDKPPSEILDIADFSGRSG